MPVEDHPTHEKTRIGDDYRHGCFNRQDFKDGYWAPDRRYCPDGRFDSVCTWIPFRMTRECKYDRSETDPHCKDCKHIGESKK